jgi:hypothetical protein
MIVQYLFNANLRDRWQRIRYFTYVHQLNEIFLGYYVRNFEFPIIPDYVVT